MRAAQELERHCWQVHDVLKQRGDLAGAADIRDRIAEAKTTQFAPSASIAEGLAFISALLVDPSLQLGAAS